MNRTLNMSGASLAVTDSGGASFARRVMSSWRALTCRTSTLSRHTQRLPQKTVILMYIILLYVFFFFFLYNKVSKQSYGLTNGKRLAYRHQKHRNFSCLLPTTRPPPLPSHLTHHRNISLSESSII